MLRHVSLALFGAVGRLANDHNRYDGLNIQFFYGLFRGFTTALVAVILVEAVVQYFCLVGVVGSASAVAAGFYAVEILSIFKNLLPLVKNKIVQKIK